MVQIHFELYYHSIHSCTLINMIRGVSRFNMSRVTLKNLEKLEIIKEERMILQKVKPHYFIYLWITLV